MPITVVHWLPAPPRCCHGKRPTCLPASGNPASVDVPDNAVMATDAALAHVVLAEDDVLLREGLASLLERSGYDVVGQCGTAPELLTLAREHRPDLAIVDIRMPPKHMTEGLDAARVIREELPQTAILVLSAHIEVEHAMDLLA